MNSRSVLRPAFVATGAAIVAVTFTACDGLKSAMSAHVDTVAHAGSQELTVDRLATLLNEAKVPPRKEVATAIANAWLDYQLLGQAAAHGDTTTDPKAIDQAMWAAVASFKARKYVDIISKGWGVADTNVARKMYDNGDVLGASHILLLTKGKSPAEAAEAEKKAAALQKEATSANFADLARKNSQDPGSAPRGGSLGLFRKGMMVPQFEQAVLLLKPGQISPVVKTEYGYHIIRRATYDDMKGDLLNASKGRSKQVSESTFVANLQRNGKLELKSDAANTARTVLQDPDAHLKDGAVIATSVTGKFTAGRLAEWLLTLPAQAQMQQREQLKSAPDSIVANFVKSFAVNELVLHAADSAKLGPTPQELNEMHRGFANARNSAWMQIGVDPRSLADSGKTATDRERIAGMRVERYMDRLVQGQAQFAEVAQPVSRFLRDQADASVNSTAIDRAVERAAKSRAAEDSTRRKSQPPSAVPMGGPEASPNGAPPAPAAPAPAPAPAAKH